MESNNNKNGSAPPESFGMTNASPVDCAVIEVSTVDGGTPTTTVQLDDGQYTEGVSLKKQGVDNAVRRIHRKVITQIILGVLRNILCWMAVVCAIILMASANDFPTWSSGRMAVVIVFFSFGLLGVGFHAARTYWELTYKYPTVVGRMLCEALPKEDFLRRIQNRQLSAPEIFLEVSLKSGALSDSDPNHWTRLSRKTSKELSYRGWADQSDSVQHFKWPARGKPAWIVVAKDFRCVDAQTQSSVDLEVAEFRKESGYEANPYFMDFDYRLQWKESDSCDDAEAFLVYEDAPPHVFNLKLYRVFLFLALDALYRIAFHIYAKNMDDYYIVKFIER